MIWLTADPHYMHDAIIESCNRPFKNSVIMDRALIRNYNSRSEERRVWKESRSRWWANH